VKPLGDSDSGGIRGRFFLATSPGEVMARAVFGAARPNYAPPGRRGVMRPAHAFCRLSVAVPWRMEGKRKKENECKAIGLQLLLIDISSSRAASRRTEAHSGVNRPCCCRRMAACGRAGCRVRRVWWRVDSAFASPIIFAALLRDGFQVSRGRSAPRLTDIYEGYSILAK